MMFDDESKKSWNMKYDHRFDKLSNSGLVKGGD